MEFSNTARFRRAAVPPSPFQKASYKHFNFTQTPLFLGASVDPALRSGPTAVSEASRQRRIFICQPVLSAFVILVLAAVAVAETVSERAATLSARLTELVATKPSEAENVIFYFARNIVTVDRGQQSIAAQLSDTELLKVISTLSAAIPTEVKTSVERKLKKQIGGNTLEALHSVDRNLPQWVAASSSLDPVITTMIADPAAKRLMTLMRDPGYPLAADVFVKLAILWKNHTEKRPYAHRVPNGRNSQETEVISTIKHIQQDRKRCVSTCGLMALERLAGADFDFDMLSSIGNLYSEKTGRGISGAREERLFPLLGLDVERIDYAEGANSGGSHEAGKIAVKILKEEVKTQIAKGKFVTLAIEGGTGNTGYHAILLTGVTDGGDFIVHDPNSGKARVESALQLADKWYVREMKTLASTIITFPNEPAAVKKTIPESHGLLLSDEAKWAGLATLGVESRKMCLVDLQSSSRSFRWVDMTSVTSKERNLKSMDGIPLVIKIQLLAGYPVKTAGVKGKPILITGYNGGLKNPDGSLRVVTETGSNWMPWNDLLKKITIRDESGSDTIFLGFYKGREQTPEVVQSSPGVGDGR